MLENNGPEEIDLVTPPLTYCVVTNIPVATVEFYIRLFDQQGLALIFQCTWQVRQPFATINLTFEIFTWQKVGICV